MNKLRWWLVFLVWKLPFVARRWCWGDAVCWSYGLSETILRADHECYYCLGCHTDEEIARYQEKAKEAAE